MTGVIAAIGAHESLTIKVQPLDVFIVRRKEIHLWLGHRGTVLDRGEVERIYAEARKSTTWIDL